MAARIMFLLFVAMVILITPSTAGVIPASVVVDSNVAIQDEDLQEIYANLVNLELGINNEYVPFSIPPLQEKWFLGNEVFREGAF